MRGTAGSEMQVRVVALWWLAAIVEETREVLEVVCEPDHRQG